MIISSEFDHRALREVMDYQGRSPEWLAEVTGYSREHVSRLLNGHLPITAKFADRAGRALGIPPMRLLSIIVSEVAA